ncbi:MAG: AAA family ATPase [Phycisphaerales bacterium JB039]
MQSNPEPIRLTEAEAERLTLLAGQAFTPRTPISSRELFAGRWGEIKQLVDAVSQVGLHVVLYGERGVGKTSLANVIPFLLEYFDKESKEPRDRPRIVVRTTANTTDSFASVWGKALDEIYWHEDAPTFGFKPKPGTKVVTLRQAYGLEGDLTIDDVRRVLTTLPGSVFIIDEFDRLPPEHTTQFTDLIKALADGAVETTIILVGVAETVDSLVRDHASIPRALVQVPLKPMQISELREILENAEKKLGIVIERDAGERIAVMSQGRPHYTHLVGLLAVRAACARWSGVVFSTDVSRAFEQAVRAADHTISKLYTEATHSAHAGALWGQVLLAGAIAAASDSDAFGYFQPASVVEPLTAILKKDRPVQISTFNGHLGEFCTDKRPVLERTGHPRAYRYRFRDPLVPPYVLMRGVADGMIGAETLAKLLRMPTTALPYSSQED